jgi:hypothetical protein
MIGAAILLALLQTPSSAAVPISSVTSVSYPAEIDQQVSAYLTCLNDKANAGMHAVGGVSEGAEVRRIYAQARVDCASVRAAMEAEADLVLKGKHWSSNKRKHTIAEGFTNADNVGESFASMVDRSNASWRAQQGKAANAPN